MRAHNMFQIIPAELNFADASKSIAYVITVLQTVLMNMVYESVHFCLKRFAYFMEWNVLQLCGKSKYFLNIIPLPALKWLCK